mmetsp:Transcript_4359/g.12572  ORF Transcript_4359/g.12572 Transcript_4359/m.12572 type:complete len:232 (+) Transcript_4359:902-1597(+)
MPDTLYSSSADMSTSRIMRITLLLPIMCRVSMVSSWKPPPSMPGVRCTMGSRNSTMMRLPHRPSYPTILSGAMSMLLRKKSSKVICAACTACDRTMRLMPPIISAWVTGWDALPSPDSRLAVPTSPIPTTQQRIPPTCLRLSTRCRKMTENAAANSISAPRIIWYTLAVTLSRPMFMSTVAMRSNTVGMASRQTSRSSDVFASAPSSSEVADRRGSAALSLAAFCFCHCCQ